ncbi:hypothetical protein [Streptomyces sp. NPDC058066]|uniref:hypothetical protein n=1 Tax=Streptomyces sp. NPDC058066 TaxID=3346323 RepID=UPI0036E3FEAE
MRRRQVDRDLPGLDAGVRRRFVALNLQPAAMPVLRAALEAVARDGQLQPRRRGEPGDVLFGVPEHPEQAAPLL